MINMHPACSRRSMSLHTSEFPLAKLEAYPADQLLQRSQLQAFARAKAVSLAVDSHQNCQCNPTPSSTVSSPIERRFDSPAIESEKLLAQNKGRESRISTSYLVQ